MQLGHASPSTLCARTALRVLSAFVLTAASAAPVLTLAAQTPGWSRDSIVALSRGSNLSRDELEGLARQASRLTSDTANVRDRGKYELLLSSFRERLTDGDFRPGDEILLRVEGQESLTGTFYVREGQLLTLVNLPDISLRGVLHSELRKYLTERIGSFVRDPDLHATALVRVAVLGQVRNPGYYRLPADAPLSDALMAAGGPTSEADLSRAVLRRNGAELLSQRMLSDALARGATLDQVNTRAGDEIFVGERHKWNWQTTFQTAAAAMGVLFSYQLLHRR